MQCTPRLRRPSLCQVGQQVDAVDDAVGRQCASGGCHHGGQDVDVRHRLFVLQAGRDVARPLGHVRHTHAAFELRQLPAAVGFVHLGQPDVARCSVVAGEDHDGVLVQPFVTQGLQHPRHAAVDRTHHRCVHAPAVVGDAGQRVVVLPAGLQRRVDAPMRQIHEERPVLVLPDRGHRFVGEIVGQVLVGFEPFAAVVTHAKTHVGPQELVDRVEILLGVDHARVVLRQVQAALHEDALVEALVVGPHLRGAAQVPFADMDVVVPTRLEQFGHRLLGGRHAQVVEVLGLAGLLLVDDHRVEPVRVGIQRGRDPGHRTRRGRELDTEAPGVTPGHECGARHRAYGSTGITVVEAHTVARDRIDRRCGGPLCGVPATIRRHIVEAQVVGQDDDDVGWPLRQRRVGMGRARHPGCGPVVPARVPDVGVPTERILEDVQAIDIGQRQHAGQHHGSSQQRLAQVHSRVAGGRFIDSGDRHAIGACQRCPSGRAHRQAQGAGQGGVHGGAHGGLVVPG